MTTINYVRNMPAAVSSPPTGTAAWPAHGRRVGAAGEVVRWAETVIAFACLCRCGIETAIAFARLCRCGIETAIAFARLCRCGIETAIAFVGEKWAFLLQFSGAEVLPVSVVPC